jgi:hypothetical protein
MGFEDLGKKITWGFDNKDSDNFEQHEWNGTGI